jgi:hypothetical protein
VIPHRAGCDRTTIIPPESRIFSLARKKQFLRSAQSGIAISF